MTTPTLTPHDAEEALAALARLLHHAALGASTRAQTEGPGSVLHLLGLGIHVVAAEAAALVGPEADPYWPAPTQQDPMELLRAAERLARTVPVDASTAGLSAVVVGIGDLVREAST